MTGLGSPGKMAAKKSGSGAARGGARPRAKSTRTKPRTRSAVLQAHLDAVPEVSYKLPAILHDAEDHRIPQAAWDALLADICETGNITQSCKRIGFKRVTVYKRAQRTEEFKDKLEEAHAIGMKSLEDHAMQRATQGVSKDIYFQGEVVGSQIEYSDQLLMFLLQGRDPRYKRKQEISGPDGQSLFYAKMTDAELDAEIERRRLELHEVPAIEHKP